MQEIKAYPYPSTVPDASLFEHPDEDYVTVTGNATHDLVASSFYDEPGHPDAIFRRLAHKHNYADAVRVYDELVAVGIEIRPHPIYHFLARHVLRDDTLDPQQRADVFLKWWSLVPTISTARMRRSVALVLAELLDDAIPDIPLLTRFALLAASKGYAKQVASGVIRTLTLYSSPEFTARFLEAFRSNAQAYSVIHDRVSQGALGHAPKRRLKQRVRFWYSLAIHEYMLAENLPAVKYMRKAAGSRKLNATPVVRLLMVRFTEYSSDLRADNSIRRRMIDPTTLVA